MNPETGETPSYGGPVATVVSFAAQHQGRLTFEGIVESGLDCSDASVGGRFHQEY